MRIRFRIHRENRSPRDFFSEVRDEIALLPGIIQRLEDVINDDPSLWANNHLDPELRAAARCLMSQGNYASVRPMLGDLT